MPNESLNAFVEEQLNLAAQKRPHQRPFLYQSGIMRKPGSGRRYPALSFWCFQ